MTDDRSTLIRLASTLPVGDEVRRIILNRVAQQGHPILVNIVRELTKKWRGFKFSYMEEHGVLDRYFVHIWLNGKNVQIEAIFVDDGLAVTQKLPQRKVLLPYKVQDWHKAVDVIWAVLKPYAEPEAKKLDANAVVTVVTDTVQRWAHGREHIRVQARANEVEVSFWGEMGDVHAGLQERNDEDDYDPRAYADDMKNRKRTHDGFLDDLGRELERKGLKQFVTRIDSMGVPEKEEVYDFRIHLRPS